MEKTVLYYIASKKMIKFFKDNTKYTLADGVSAELSRGDVVDVEVDADKVTKITKVDKQKETKTEEKVEAPKEEAKDTSTEDLKKQVEKFQEKVKEEKEAVKEEVVETPKAEEVKQEPVKADNTVTKEVAYVSQYGVKFVNEDKWTNFSKELQATGLKDKGIARKIIKATIEDSVVTAYEVVAEPAKEEKKEGSTQTKTTNTAQYRNADEMNRRDALENASNIVVALIKSKELDKTKVKDTLKDLTKTAYEALTELN